MGIGFLDQSDGPLSEASEIAEDLGLGPDNPLSEATEWIQDQIAAQGLPPVTFRFLLGTGQWASTEPVQSNDPEDYVAQAGRLVDNLVPGPGLHGQLGAAVANRYMENAVPGWEFQNDRPGWWVRTMEAEEGLNTL